MSGLDSFLPMPRLVEIDHVDVGVPVERAWQAARHLDMSTSPIVRSLFSLRTLPQRLRGIRPEDTTLRIDNITSGSQPGFRILGEGPGASVIVGAIGKVWQPEIEFIDVPAAQFARFNDPGWTKVAWELRCEPRGSVVSRIILELRVTATDDVSWQKFRNYFHLIGPFSHFLRLHALGALAKKLGGPQAAEHTQPLPGDDLIPDAAGAATDGVTIRASAESVWPWLVQMGCRRAGWYSWDVLDNAGIPSAREIIDEFQTLHIGDILPATPKGKDGFEVLQIDRPAALVIGILFDRDVEQQLPFNHARPKHFYQMTWSFSLELIDERTTRVHVRARAAFGEGLPDARQYLMMFMHPFMQTAQLRNLRARVETAELARSVPHG